MGKSSKLDLISKNSQPLKFLNWAQSRNLIPNQFNFEGWNREKQLI